MNKKEFSECKERFNINFGGKTSIGAASFTSAIEGISKLIKASAGVIDPSCFIKLEIVANKAGSFQTVLNLITTHASDLLVYPEIANDVIQGVVGFISLQKHLKGRKAKKIEANANDSIMSVQNQENEQLRVLKKTGQQYFSDSTISESIINVINIANADDREYFSIESKNGSVKINKDEYSRVSSPVVDDYPEVEKVSNKPIEVDLHLKKPDLLGNSKWEFQYNKKIEAKIMDEKFLKNVRNGHIKTLYAGVRIPCILVVEYDLDQAKNIVPNSEKYTILKITGDIIEPEQSTQTSFFNESD